MEVCAVEVFAVEVFAVEVGSTAFALEVEEEVDEEVEGEVEEVVVGTASEVVELVVGGSEPTDNPAGVSSVAVCPKQTHCSQSVVA